jgi:bifunctional non-homologous end joining protein LigD
MLGDVSGSQRVAVQIEGRDLSLSNLDKVLYPADGFTKAEVIDYYTRIAPVLLPHLHNRAATRVRFPDGVGGPSFFEKNAPNHTPDWVRTVTLPAPGSTKDREEVRYVVVADLPTLVWLANLAALELHVHQWQVASPVARAAATRTVGSPGPADRLVLDLDPGAPAALPECAQVALLLREELGELGLDPVVKTSGSKGLQLYVGLAPTPVAEVHTWAKALAERMAKAAPDRVVHRMEKALRGGKVLIDWSQNAGAKTTVAPYSLRAREHPTVSTPVDWDEVARAAAGEPLAFTAGEVLDRVAARGDLFGGLLHDAAALP